MSFIQEVEMGWNMSDERTVVIELYHIQRFYSFQDNA